MNDLIDIIDRALGVATPRWFVPERLARAVGWGAERLHRGGAALKIRRLSGEPLITRGKIDVLCRHRGYSSAAAVRVLGYAPRVGVEEGLARTIAWMQAARGPRAARPDERGAQPEVS